MPKIDTYSLDSSITDNDSLLGIDSASGATKRYQMSALKTYVASVADIEGVTAGTGLTGGGTSGTVTLAVAAAQTGITSVVNTSLEIGRDADNRIKFGTDNQIIFEVDGGDNVIFWGPLAKTVIFGLTFATFLTLIIVPATFLISYQLKTKFKRIFKS